MTALTLCLTKEILTEMKPLKHILGIGIYLVVLFGFLSIFAKRLKTDQDKETAQRMSLYKILDEPIKE